MKFDMTKLPVLEAVIGFLLITLVITFYLGFTWVNDESEEEQPAVSETPSPTSSGPAGNEVAVMMDDNFFDPEQIAVAADQEITFNLTNDGSAIHDMHIAGADNEYDSEDDAVSDPEIVSGGQDAVLTWQSPAAGGEIDFRCDFHPDQMTGTITVQ
jgi:plastocyanin